MSDPIRPQRLLNQAKALAGYGAGRGRPDPTDHRRAVSSAYYALFHALNLEAVAQAVPVQVAGDDDRLRAARWMDHADVKRACNWIFECSKISSPTTTPATKTGAKHGVWELFSTPLPSGGRVSAVPSFLRRIARTFVDLQDARHAADYDHLAEFPKATARRHIESAESALSLLAANTADPAMGRFLALLAFSSSRLPR